MKKSVGESLCGWVLRSLPESSALPVLLGMFCSSATLAQPTFTNLGVLLGGSSSFARGANTEGWALAGWGDSPNGPRAVRWTSAGGMQNLGSLAASSYGYAVSGDGTTVVGESGSRAFRWTSAEGMQDLGALATFRDSAAFGLSADGSVVVGWNYNPTGVYRAFRWTSAGGMQNLGTLSGGGYSLAYGVSSDGSVVVGYSDSPTDRAHAFRWTLAGGMQNLGALPGADSSLGYAVSSDGTTVVGECGTRAFRWTTAGGMQDLGQISGENGFHVYSVNADGYAVAGYGDAPGGTRALLWTSVLGMRDLNVYLPTLGVDLTGWSLQLASVSGDGSTVAGYGTFNGATRAWVVRGLCSSARLSSQPVAQPLLPGQTAIFSITASGTMLNYQWRKTGVNLSNGARIAGATSAILTISDVQSNDQGNYDCVASNSCSSATSDTAALSCRPIISQQPPGQVRLRPGLRLNVVASTGTTYTYRWRQNGQSLFNINGLITGVTTSTLTLVGADPSLAGTFDCVLADSCGTTTSVGTMVLCPADFDDGSVLGHPDGGVTIEDLLYYLVIYGQGVASADLDDGSSTGVPDGGVTLEDLLYFLERFSVGC